MTDTQPPRARLERAQRRLLTVARDRYAEDRLADAVSAGIRQVVLFGAALDGFAAHNPYGVRILRYPTAKFEPAALRTGDPVFVVHLGGCTTGPRLSTALGLLGDCAPGSEIVFDCLPEFRGGTATLLRDTGWEMLEELDSRALASRYLDHATPAAVSIELRVARARVRHNAGRLPS